MEAKRQAASDGPHQGSPLLAAASAAEKAFVVRLCRAVGLRTCCAAGLLGCKARLVQMLRLCNQKTGR